MANGRDIDLTALSRALRGGSDLQDFTSTNPFSIAGSSILRTPIPVQQDTKPLEAFLLGAARGGLGGILSGIGGGQARDQLDQAQQARASAQRKVAEAAAAQEAARLQQQHNFRLDQIKETGRQNRLTKGFGASGLPGGDVLGKVGSKLMEKELIAAAENADKGQNLISIGERVLPVVDKAGHTGIGAGVVGTLLQAESALGSKGASETLENRAVLESVAPEVIAAARAAGSGSMSDFESKLYAGAGPSTSRTPEENRRLAHTLIERGKRTVEFNDFLKTWAQARGTTTGARRAWADYEKQFPISTPENMKRNPRPDWRDFFSGQSAAQAPAPNPADFQNAQDYVAAFRAWEKQQ